MIRIAVRATWEPVQHLHPFWHKRDFYKWWVPEQDAQRLGVLKLPWARSSAASANWILLRAGVGIKLLSFYRILPSDVQPKIKTKQNQQTNQPTKTKHIFRKMSFSAPGPQQYPLLCTISFGTLPRDIFQAGPFWSRPCGDGKSELSSVLV